MRAAASADWITLTNTGDCPEFGTELNVGGSTQRWGDVDCSGIIDVIDALKLLRFDAGLSVLKPEECPDIGDEVVVA